MFEDLLADGSTAERCSTAPLHDERLHYLEHCAEAGARQDTLYRIAVCQMHLVNLLDLQSGDRVDITGIEAAVAQWSRPGGRRSSKPAGADARRRFVGHAVRWLRFAGMFEEAPCPPRHTHTDEVAALANWMRVERGWAPETIRGCCNTADRFFDRLDEFGVLLASVRIDDIDSQVAYWRTCGHSRVTVNNYVQRLRALFRFAERQGWCRPGLAEGIMPPRFHAGEPLPKGLDRDEVMRLLATTEGDRPADLRDRAILMLLITYGLRAGEVAGLSLDDIDWEQERLQVRCPKPGRTHHYPLSRGVGQAVLRYVREARPTTRRERALFLSLQAPVRPLRTTAIGSVVGRRADRIGITGKRCRAHALRHGVAQHLLDHGLSMKEVGDYLGHRSVSATSAYAKVRFKTLREVAGIDLEGMA